jgi:hypothetical protein
MLRKMMSYKRPAFSPTEETFIKRFIEPTGAQRDSFGNLYLRIGESDVMFASHTDTVHRTGGRQYVQSSKGVLSLPKNSSSNCLGADCTTGVYIMLRMVQARVPGLYVFHRAEEVGCLGSRHIVSKEPGLTAGINKVVSFDRRGTDSVVTHQMGRRTASDRFAFGLSYYLDMRPDSTGVYTDSNEYAHIVSECTNVSVGYFNQHTRLEEQNVDFVEGLIKRIINTPWSDICHSRKIFDEFVFDDFSDTTYDKECHYCWREMPLSTYDGGVELCRECAEYVGGSEVLAVQDPYLDYSYHKRRHKRSFSWTV